MANVLPLQTQKKLWRIYRARFIIAFSVFMLGFALLGVILFIPSYFVLRIAAVPADGAVSTHSESASEDIMAVARAQALVRTLQTLVSTTSSPSHSIASVLSNRPKGVLIERITYLADEGQFLLSGSASREALNAYHNVLLRNPAFTSVSIPVAALVGNEGGNFSITLTGSL